MKKLILISLLSLFSIGLYAAPEAKITLIRGKVEILAEDGNWVAAKENSVIPVNTMISTGFNSSAVISLNNVNMIVSSLTRMKIEELEEKEEVQNTAVFLQNGKVKTQVNSESQKQNFKFRSPVSTASVRGTDFTYTGSRLIVHSGSVDFHNNIGQRVNVRTGRKTRAQEKERPEQEDQDQEQNIEPIYIQLLNTDLENQFSFLNASGEVSGQVEVWISVPYERDMAKVELMVNFPE